jgi:hypothetical protein
MRTHTSFALKPLALALGLAAAGAAEAAEVTLPTLDVGAGLRTSFTSVNYSDSNATNTDDFSLDSIRLYVNGKVDDQIKFTFNTEYTGSPPGGQNTVQVMDAIGRFEFSPKMNIWAGRFLPPSDRANLYGPYYANNWSVYTDGVQDGYPSTAVGRDNGVAYWGDFGKFKLSIGEFDIPSTTGNNDTLAAARVQLDLWDPEPGYYLNGTYYGDKDILAFGLAGQQIDGDRKAYTADFLLEKKVGDGGAFSIESEYAKYDGLGGYDAAYKESDGYYGLVAYLFPQKIGMGKVQVLAKLAKANFTEGLTPNYDTTTTEGDVNYIIKGFNARVSLFVRHTAVSNATPSKDSTAAGLGLQLQI